MKITFISSGDLNGGAAKAAFRLFMAIRKRFLNPEMLVFQKNSRVNEIISTSNTFFKGLQSFFTFSFERFIFSLYEKSKSLRFAFSIANTGKNITKYDTFKKADIIHLHWFNQGFISLKGLEKTVTSGKPVVWTLHDMWAFTGGCHYSGECTNFKNECRFCPFLKNPSKHDLSNKVFQKKVKLFKKAKNLHFVTCSHWLKNEALQSKLISNYPVHVIPNPIDVHMFKPPTDTAQQKKSLNLEPAKKYLLFGSANINDERKGFKYLLQSLEYLKGKITEQEKNSIEIIIFGKNKDSGSLKIPFKCHEIGSIASEEKLIKYYSVAEAFILPSLQDNLPNTVVEALACGTPVVAFNTGGIPDMIQHQKNGYLANLKSAKDLSAGIHWIFSHPRYNELSQCARETAVTRFNEDLISQKYLHLYESILPV